MVAKQLPPVGHRRWPLFQPAPRTLLHVALLVCALLLVGSSGFALDNGIDWDAEFPYPVYVIYITETGTPKGPVPQDRYILYGAEPQDGVLLTPDDWAGWEINKAKTVGGPYSTPRAVCDAVGGTKAQAFSFRHVPQLPYFRCEDLQKDKDCKAWCQERFDKDGVEYAMLHPESSTGTPPKCECWCEVEGVGLTSECFIATRDCDKVCGQQYGAHAVWDGSNAEYCTQCICETGWKMENDKCISCTKFCTRRDSRAQHDKENSGAEFCACKCDEQKLLEFDDETGTCRCIDHAQPKGNQCICKADWEPIATGGCRQCPRHATSDPGKECTPKPGYKWKDSSREELVCDESAGYYWNSDQSECLQVRGPTTGYDNPQKLIDEMTDPAGPQYTIQKLPPGTRFSATDYPPGTIVLWDLDGRAMAHSTMIIDDNGLQIEMSRQARTFVTTPSPIQVGNYTPVAVLIPPPGSKVKLPKLLKLVGMDRYDGDDWNCHGFMRSLKPYVAIPDPTASLPASCHSMPGSSATLMKDPPGIPLTLELQQGALYGDDVELHAFLPGGFAEVRGKFLIEVDEEGSSQLSVTDGEATYYADGDAGGVRVASEQTVAIRNGQASQPAHFDTGAVDLWWVEDLDSREAGLSLGLPEIALAGIAVAALIAGTLLVGGLVAWQVVRGRRRQAGDRVRPGQPRSAPRRASPAPGPWASLSVSQGQAQPRCLDLRHPVLTIGRSASNDLVLPDTKISRHHARLERRAGGAVLTDLGSTNGTFLNGKPVRGTQPLFPGQVIRLGHTQLVFEAGSGRHGPAPDRRPPGQAGGHPRRISLPAGETVLIIGRSSECDVVLADRHVSRRHAQIHREQGITRIHDLGSTSGTYVNGMRISQPRLLQPGDVIRVGHTELVF